MSEIKKLHDLTKIIKIRSLEKIMAQQALVDAQILEEKNLLEKEKSEKVLLESHKNWETHLSEGSMITEQLEYYANDLISNMTEHKNVEDSYEHAVQNKNTKMSSLKLCDTISKKTNELYSKLRRKHVLKSEQRTLDSFEERVSYLWSRKT